MRFGMFQSRCRTSSYILSPVRPWKAVLPHLIRQNCTKSSSMSASRLAGDFAGFKPPARLCHYPIVIEADKPCPRSQAMPSFSLDRLDTSKYATSSRAFFRPGSRKHASSALMSVISFDGVPCGHPVESFSHWLHTEMKYSSSIADSYSTRLGPR